MKIYIGHSRGFDYINELYKPLRQSDLNSKIELIFPHENSSGHFNSKEDLKKVDFMVAEASYPSTGLGIEMGYADIFKIPIILSYKTGSTVSDSAKRLATHIIEYSNPQSFTEQLSSILKV